MIKSATMIANERVNTVVSKEKQRGEVLLHRIAIGISTN